MYNSKEIVECPNCGLTYDSSLKYCSNCGQKSALPGLSLTTLIKEYVDIVFNFEYRVWVSLFHLLIPGKLSIQFFDGKRQKYLSPIRIFLIFGLLHFTLFGNWVNKKFDKQLTALEKYVQENAYKEQFFNKIDSLPNQIFEEEGLDTSQTIAIKSKLFKELKFDSLDIPVQQKDSIDLDSLSSAYKILVVENLNGKWEFKSLPLRFTDIYNLDDEIIIRKANIKTDFGKWQVRQEIKLQKEIKNFTFFATSQLIWMVIFSMLLISFFQRILYFRLPYFYAHHLIYNLHFHAFSFLTMSLYMLGNEYKAILENFHLFIFSILIYQIVALRNIFKQGWIKTIFKALVIDGMYFILSMSVLLLTLIISMLTF